MSITDELRKWKGNIIADLRPEMALTLRRQLNGIADRIDAEHELERRERYNREMDASGWIRLPVDADGVPIHVGDRLEHVNGAFTANDLTVSIDGLWRSWDGENGHTVLLSKCHHVLTVEDVLDEFFGKANLPDGTQTRAEIIAEYAAKLRLAGDGE